MKGHLIMSLKELDRLKVLEQVKQKMLKQKQAADLLNLTDRNIRRLVKILDNKGQSVYSPSEKNTLILLLLSPVNNWQNAMVS